MNIVLIGCGRVGSQLATMLDSEGHQVQIVDINEENFKSLPSEFKGFKTTGIPIDLDVLKNANIKGCDAVAAVTPNDNMNIMIGQLAKEIFDVPNVLVRISDPMQEAAFSEIGLKTICPTNLTVAAAKSGITDLKEAQTLNFATTTISFTCKPIDQDLIGTLVSDYKLEDKQNFLQSIFNNEEKKKDKKMRHVYGILHENNQFELYHGKQLRFEKGDQVVISTIVD